ncbi:unnamed protein product [Rhodiola kirilowii]
MQVQSSSPLPSLSTKSNCRAVNALSAPQRLLERSLEEDSTVTE